MPGLSQTRAYLALALIVTLWGTFPSTAKLALRDFPPTVLVSVRCLIASAFLVALRPRAGVEAARGLDRASLRAFATLGLFGLVLSTQVTYLGIYLTTAANAAILQATTPVMIALGARFYLGERLRAAQRVGIAVSACGVLVVVTEGRLATLRLEELRAGDFLTLLAQAGWAAYTVYGKRVLASHPPALATAAAYVAGTAMLLLIGVAAAPFLPRPAWQSGLAWAIVLYHALLGAVAHVWWYRAVERVGASRSAIFMNFTPIVGVGLAAALLAERIGLWHALGAGLVLAGVGLTTRRPRAHGDEEVSRAS